jgi:hypothetical protein
MLSAACNSLPFAKVDRIIPRGEDVKWVIGYHFFEFEQSHTITLAWWSGGGGSDTGWSQAE